MGSELSGWRECSVAELASTKRNAIVGGPFGSNLVSRDYTPQGVPVIRGQNLSWGGRYVGGEFVFVSEEKAESLSANLATAGDLVFTQRGNAVLKGGQVAIVPEGGFERYVVSQSQMKMSPSPALADTLFLYYVFTSRDHEVYLRNNAIATGVPHTNLGILRDYSFSLPPLPEQHAIARILSTLDDKIELNRRMNVTLEGMAQALFKSWFVDFDPVIDNALAAGNPIPAELADRAEVRRAALADGTANRETAKPFPAAFQQTEQLGWVPEGWEAVSINDAIEINPRLSLPKGTVATYADMKALPTSGYAISGVISKAYSGGSKFQNRDVLLARITPCLENGKTGIVDFLDSESEVGFGSTEFIVLREKGRINLPFIACLAREENFRLHCIQSMVGSSGRQRVQNACFDSFHVALPADKAVLETFTRTTEAMFRKSSDDGFTSRNLIKLRDTLLPKLISGELRIPDAEKLAEEALA